MNVKSLVCSALWGAMSSLMGFGVMNGIRGFVVCFLGAILIIILTWEND